MYSSCILLGNDMIPGESFTQQTVDYYEVAVGTDRRYPKTRDNVVTFTNVGRNTTVVFPHLQLSNLATLFITVRAHSKSFATADETSNGITVGVEARVDGKIMLIL